MSVYRLERRSAVMTAGLYVVLAAPCAAVAILLLSRDGVVGVVGIVLAVLAVGLLGGALRFALRPPVQLRLDPDGFTSPVRWKGTRFRGCWADVDRVEVVGDVLHVVGTGGEVKQLPLVVLWSERNDVVRDVHERLNTAHGYRRLEP